MAILHIEKRGGLANFGGMSARIRSQGQIDTEQLSPADQNAVDSLFQNSKSSKTSRQNDGFRVLISRTSSTGTETVEAPEDHVPAALMQCVKDEFV